MLFEETLINGIDVSDGRPDDGLQSDLVDDPGQAFGHVKDQLDGLISEELLRSLAALQMKTDIVSGVLNGKASEAVREDNTLSEGFILGLFKFESEPL